MNLKKELSLFARIVRFTDNAVWVLYVIRLIRLQSISFLGITGVRSSHGGNHQHALPPTVS